MMFVGDVFVMIDFVLFVVCVCCQYVDEVWIVLLFVEDVLIMWVIDKFCSDFVELCLMFDVSQYVLFGSQVDEIFGELVILFVVLLLLCGVLCVKVVFDCVFVVVVLIVLMLLLFVIVVVIKLSLLGLVMFMQKWCGGDGCMFDIYKFCMMCVYVG